jgi:hypothetical protein
MPSGAGARSFIGAEFHPLTQKEINMPIDFLTLTPLAGETLAAGTVDVTVFA